MMRAVLCALLAVPLAAQTVIQSSGASGGGGGGTGTSSNTELLWNSSSTVDGVPGSAWDGTYLTLPNFVVGAMRCTASAGVMTCQDPTATTGITGVIVKGGDGQSTNPIFKIDNSAGTEIYAHFADDDNVRIGTNAGDALTTGSNNVALGPNALGGATVGSHNVAVGSGAMLAATTTSSTRQNVSIGRGSLAGCNGCELNVVIGDQAGNDIGNGDRNTIIGASAHSTTSNTSDNVIIGYSAGADETGSDTLIIDNQDRGSEAAGRTDSLIYGTFNAAASSQTLHLNAAVRATQSLEVGNVGALIYPPSASEPVDCTASNDGSMYFDTTDQTMCVCANDGADEWQKIQDMTTDCSI